MRILPMGSQDGGGKKSVKLDADFAYGESGRGVKKSIKLDADFAYVQSGRDGAKIGKIRCGFCLRTVRTGVKIEG